MTTTAAAGLVALAVWLGSGHVRPPVRARTPRVVAGVVTRWRAGPVAVGVGLVGGALVLGVPVLLLPTVAVLGWAATALAGAARRDAQVVRRRERVVEACEVVLGELVAGQPPTRALDRAARAWPELVPAAGAARLGGDVPASLRTLAALPGAGAVDRLAGAWQLCGSSGSGLSASVAQVLGSVRAEHEVALAVRSELASARATARLLAVLPLLVLAMGQGIGAHPWRFLLASPAGHASLGAGVTLAVAGVMWLERIADDVQGERR